MTPCLHCTGAATGRGLCKRHWHAARKLVKAGVKTWEALEAVGRARPAITTYENSRRWMYGNTA